MTGFRPRPGLAAACAAAARPVNPTDEQLLRGMVTRVHVITDLGPTDGPGLLVPAELGRFYRAREDWRP